MDRFFEGQANLRHYDMVKPEEAEQVRDLLEQVPQGYLYYPLVFINGELRIIGSAQYYEILGEVRDLLQA